jgi:hypothetical protein
VKNKLKAITEEFEKPLHDSKKQNHESQGILMRHNGTMIELPSFPEWFNTHPFMTDDFAHGSEKGGSPLTLGMSAPFAAVSSFTYNYFSSQGTCRIPGKCSID